MASESYPATAGRPLVLALVDTIETNRAYLSEVDGAIGDGDHGINMSKGFALTKTRLGDQTISVSDGLASIGKTLITEIGGAMEQMADAAEQGKESTRDLVAKIGRASRLGERSRGMLDAGATSCSLILKTFAKVLSGGQ